MSGQPGEVAVLDLAPAAGDLRADFIAGLSSTPRTLPCKYFYDERGSELFRQICELPEYYITRTEMALLETHALAIAEALGRGVALIGLGTGAGTKTRMLIEQLREPVAYIPVDISREQLLESSARFSRDFPAIEILPVCADYLQPFLLPSSVHPARRRAVYFPGSTIGNFEPEAATEFLSSVAGYADLLLIGVDLRKPKEIIERAYNDSAGVTAAFNLNLLQRANREIGANFDLTNWEHAAVYNEELGRIEMYLVSQREQTVAIGDASFVFAPDEHISTEYSYKHSPEGFASLAADAGFQFRKLWTDDANLFGLFLFDR